MVANFLFKDREGQTPLPPELLKGLKIKGIQTIGELDEHEEANITKGLIWLANSNQNDLVYNFWLKLHKKLFGNVWNWAGKVRQHELNNPDFAAPHQIWPSMYQLEENMNYWVTAKTFTIQEISARFHERLLTIHPFANGNGRFSRIVVEHFMEKRNEMIPSWGDSLKKSPKQRRDNYIQAIETARRQKEYSDLIRFMFS